MHSAVFEAHLQIYQNHAKKQGKHVCQIVRLYAMSNIEKNNGTGQGVFFGLKCDRVPKSKTMLGTNKIYFWLLSDTSS